MTYNSDNLNIMTWNIRSIHTSDAFGNKTLKTQHKEIYDMFMKHDIISIMETWCTDEEARSLEDDNFKVIFSNRKYRDPKAKRISGGVLFLIKKEIFKGVKRMISSSDDVIWLKLDRCFFNLEKDIYLCNAYLPPSGSSIFRWYNVDVCEMLELDVIRYSKMGDIIICGDLNARVGNLNDFVINDDNSHIPVPKSYDVDTFSVKRHTQDSLYYNEYGRWLIDLCISARLALLNGRCLGDLRGLFTSHQPEGSSVVDYNIVNKDFFNKVRTFSVHSLTDFSDHCPLSLNVNIHKSLVPESKSSDLSPLPSRYVWEDNSKDKLLYQLSLQETNDRLVDFMSKEYVNNSSGVDSAINDFEAVLNSTVSKCIKRRVVKPARRYHKKFVFDEKCYKIRTQLHYIRGLMEKYPYNRDIRRCYYNVKRMYEKSVKLSKSELKNTLLNRLEDLQEKDSKTYWDLFNKIRNGKNITKMSPISATEWLEHYKSLYSKPEEDDIEILHDLHAQEMKQQSVHELDEEITDKELYLLIKKLKNGKSPGPDGIINEVIKTGKHHLGPLLKKIFNLILSVGYFPRSWRKGLVINIHKSGIVSDPNNYRGITLSSSIGKLFSGIMNLRLINMLNVKDLYSKYQFGFREDYRTADNIFIMNKLMSNYRHAGKKLYIAYIDFKKAFDRVWRTGLLLKIMSLGVGGNFYNVIKSMYTDNLTAVKTNGMQTRYFGCHLGVRQGDSLSPTLFNIYVNDLEHIFNSPASEPARYGNITVGFLMYADDLVIMSESAMGLQNSLAKLNEYCRKWKLKVNANKSKIMIAAKKKCSVNDVFKIDNEVLELVNNYKYLGVNISSNGSMQNAQDQLVNKGLKTWFYIRNNLYSAKVWPLSVYLKSFDMIVKPLILYGCETWGQYIFMNKERKISGFPKFNNNYACERAHIKICKQILGVQQTATNLAVLGELGRLPLCVDIVKYLMKYYIRVERMERMCLLTEIYSESKQNDNDLERLIKYICEEINFPLEDYFSSSVKSLVTSLNKYMSLYYENTFFSILMSESSKKLRTYKCFKKVYDMEKYLLFVQNPFHRRELTRFRISAHNLFIEQGRYKKVEIENRKCRLCDLKKVEDEFHFFMQCPFYSNLRKKYIRQLSISYEDPFSWDAFLYIMQLQDNSDINQISLYVYRSMEKRRSYLYLYK